MACDDHQAHHTCSPLAHMIDCHPTIGSSLHARVKTEPEPARHKFLQEMLSATRSSKRGQMSSSSMHVALEQMVKPNHFS